VCALAAAKIQIARLLSSDGEPQLRASFDYQRVQVVETENRTFLDNSDRFSLKLHSRAALCSAIRNYEKPQDAIIYSS
jgi:hypothetical protein